MVMEIIRERQVKTYNTRRDKPSFGASIGGSDKLMQRKSGTLAVRTSLTVLLVFKSSWLFSDASDVLKSPLGISVVYGLPNNVPALMAEAHNSNKAKRI